MIKWSGWWGSLRFRLIGWYVLLLVFTLAIFSVYFFVQFRNIQQGQQDASLTAAADRLFGGAGGGGGFDPGRPNGNGGIGNGAIPGFRRDSGNDPVLQDLLTRGVQARIISASGQVVDTLGNAVSEMPTVALPVSPGLSTVNTTSNGQWRIFIRPLPFGAVLEVGQPIAIVNTELGNLFTPILIGTALALILAVLGGLFLANRALRPIDRVTRTAQAISTQDLSRRIDYHGPKDEIGRLSQTIDQMLDRLEKGFEQERRFTSDASHELRTPLTALKGRIEVTLSQPRPPEEYRETLVDLNQEVNRLVRLSNSLLYLARLDQANHMWQSETLNLSDLLDSIVDSMQAVAELKAVNLSSNIPTDIDIPGNLDQLTRLFLNLVDNAIKYTPAGGDVRVRLERIDGNKRVCIAISDTGPGVAPEHLPHLFERFYRADSDRASNSGGAGLGLAIAYEIARQHGGNLEVSSEVGKGTTFRVILPLQVFV